MMIENVQKNVKTDWHNLCLEMMVEYIPHELDTWEGFNKFQEVCDHFISLSRVLSERTKSELNKADLMIDENEDVDKIAQIIKRLARQNYEFVKKRLIEEGLYADS